MGKRKMYVNKNFVFDAREVEENGEAVSRYGTMPVFAGEVILTDLYGNELPETKSLLDEHYIQVKIDESKLKVDKDDMAAQYASWSLNSDEDENYITSFQQKVRERNI